MCWRSKWNRCLEIALQSLKLKKDSEVIVPVNTWVATASSVVRTGYKLVFCDINLNDYCIDIEDLKKKISLKTKVIIPVHLYGHPAKLDQIKNIQYLKNLAFCGKTLIKTQPHNVKKTKVRSNISKKEFRLCGWM